MESSSLKIYEELEFNPFDYVDENIHWIEYSGPPTFFCDLSELIWKWRNWKRAMPSIKPYYSVKSNSDLMVLRVLERLGAGFNCSSEEEIEKVIKLGVNSSRIIFANPVKYAYEMKTASDKNVNILAFDRESELEKIEKYHPKAKLLLKIRMREDEEEFGCESIKEGPILMKMAKEKGLEVVGIQFEGDKNPESFEKGIERSSKLFEIGKDLGFEMTYLQIGGGFPTQKDEKALQLFYLSISEAMEKFFSNFKNVELIADVGDYFSGSPFSLFTTIQGSREIFKEDLKSFQYCLNFGDYNSVKVLENNKEIVDIKGYRRRYDHLYEDSKQYFSTLIGHSQVFENILLTRNVLLPSLKWGDLIYFSNMGAFTLDLNSNTNGLLGAEVKYFINKQDFRDIFECDL